MKSYKILPLLALGAMTLAGCQEDPVLPPVVVPEAPMLSQVNSKILDVKTQYWDNEKNYIKEIGLTSEGEHVIVKGRVTGVDVSGNIFKYLYIQDETAALGFSIDASSLADSYKLGQELVVDLTEMNIGKWNTELLVGKPEWYEAGQVWESGRMELATFQEHVELNGLPGNDGVEPTVLEMGDIINATNAEDLIKYGHMLVTFEDVTIDGAGQPFVNSAIPLNSNAYYHTITDSKGAKMYLPVSSYADFAYEAVPTGRGNVTGILCYKYLGINRQSQWALYLVDFDGLSGFDGAAEEPGTGDDPSTGNDNGTKDSPYTVEQVITLGNPGSEAWVKGYIVGFYDYNNNSSLVNSASGASNSNLALAADPNETDKEKTVAVQLPIGALRSELNLLDHPENLGKELAICGKLEAYFGLPGVKNGTEAIFDGKSIGGAADVPAGETSTFEKVTEITSGGVYAFWANNKIGAAFSADKNYGYLTVTDCTPAADGTITASNTANGFTFTLTADGWTIQNPDGRYLMMTGTFNSINLSASLDTSDSGFFWSINVDSNGQATITNLAMNKTMQYDPSYNSYGWYSDERGVKPTLFKSK